MYFENDVDNYNTMLFLKGNIIANNYVRNQGGALYMIYQIGIITQNVFQNNSATTSGGAIYYEENRTFIIFIFFSF